MTHPLHGVELPTVADIGDYLMSTGWRRLPETWHGAPLWHLESQDTQALVPPSDALGDSDRRKREVLRVLSTVERRPAADIARDIRGQTVDVVSVHTHPLGLPTGRTKLNNAVVEMRGLDRLFAVNDRIGRQTIAGYGRNSDPLGQVQLGPSYPGSYVYTVEVPAGHEDARHLLTLVRDSVTAAAGAVSDMGATGDLGSFDGLELPADLCTALARLTGPDRRQPFEITFQWADSAPARVETIIFAPGAGEVLHRAARHLRTPAAGARATITGRIEDLHDGSGGRDRFRIKVRGLLLIGDATSRRRTCWLRLPDEAAYTRAMTTHLDRVEVRLTFNASSGSGTPGDPYRLDRFPVSG